VYFDLTSILFCITIEEEENEIDDDVDMTWQKAVRPGVCSHCATQEGVVLACRKRVDSQDEGHDRLWCAPKARKKCKLFVTRLKKKKKRD
jgi:hypothetical protein